MPTSEIVQQGETLVIPCSDPAVEIVRGYRRFLVGLDIAQSAGTVDATAFAIILDERIPEWGDAGQQLGKRRRTIVRAEKVPAMSYVQLAQVTRNLMQDKSIARNSCLAVDASGGGRSFCDTLDALSVQHTRITITGGENESESKERGVTFNNVSKNLLLNTFNSGLHVGDLTIGDFPLRDELTLELEAFETKVGTTGRTSIQGGTKAGHSDIAMAASMAFWLSDHRTIGAHVGEAPLRGFW